MVDLFDVGFVGVVVSYSNIGIGFLPRIRDRISRWEMSGGFVVTRAYEDSVPLQGSAGVITGLVVGSVQLVYEPGLGLATDARPSGEIAPALVIFRVDCPSLHRSSQSKRASLKRSD